MTSYAADLCSGEPKVCHLDSPESVLEFWFGSLDNTELESVSYIESMMGIWFAGKSPVFDQVQRDSVSLVERVGENGPPLGEEWCTPAGIWAPLLLIPKTE